MFTRGGRIQINLQKGGSPQTLPYGLHEPGVQGLVVIPEVDPSAQPGDADLCEGGEGRRRGQ